MAAESHLLSTAGVWIGAAVLYCLTWAIQNIAGNIFYAFLLRLLPRFGIEEAAMLDRAQKISRQALPIVPAVLMLGIGGYYAGWWAAKPTQSATANQLNCLHDVGVRGIIFDGNGLAGTGIKVDHVCGGDFTGTTGENTTQEGIDITNSSDITAKNLAVRNIGLGAIETLPQQAPRKGGDVTAPQNVLGGNGGPNGNGAPAVVEEVQALMVHPEGNVIVPPGSTIRGATAVKTEMADPPSLKVEMPIKCHAENI